MACVVGLAATSRGSTHPTALARSWQRLFSGTRRLGSGHGTGTDPVVGHHHASGRVPSWHVTTDTARLGRDLAGGLRGSLVAGQARGLVRREVSRRLGVRVVAARARQGSLALSVTGRLHQADRLEAHERGVLGPDQGTADRLGQAMAGSTHANLIERLPRLETEGHR